MANTTCTIGNVLFSFGPASTENYINNTSFTGTILYDDPIQGPVSFTAISPDSIPFDVYNGDPMSVGFDLGDLSVLASAATILTQSLQWSVNVRLLDPSLGISALEAGSALLNEDQGQAFFGWGSLPSWISPPPIYFGPYSVTGVFSPLVTEIDNLPISFGGQGMGGGGGFIAGDFYYRIDVATPEPNSLLLFATALGAILAFCHPCRYKRRQVKT